MQDKETRPGFRSIHLLAVILIGAAGAGCATGPESERDPRDPFEPVNRKIYAFNDTLDRYALRPTAVAYRDHVPSPIRSGVGNFLDNLSYPTVIVGSALQGKFGDAFADTGRFLINTTIGIGGIFDPASLVGLEANNEDFGQTLGVWGVGPGPYMVLPALGSSTVRDTGGMVADGYIDPTYSEIPTPARYGVYLIRAVDTRVGLLEADQFLEDEYDPYVSLREAYLQQRRHAVYDGNPPVEEIEDWDEGGDDEWDW